MLRFRWPARSLALVIAAMVAACGGNSDVPAGGATSTKQATQLDDAGAARLLTQTTFGPTPADIANVRAVGLENWINRQMSMGREATGTHLDYVLAQLPIPTPEGVTVTIDPVYHSFWRQALAAPDQLRQRVAFALSQIMVTSTMDGNLARQPHGMASYLDIFAEHAFGNYRDILQAVSLHPTMGLYLTSLANRGDNGRTPDENYAREVMQLFSIGLFELNMDGTPKLINGAPVETYDMDDIRNLAKVFTGWSWGNQGTPDPTNARFSGSTRDAMRNVVPMQFYPQYHSPDAKSFLNVTIAAGTDGRQALNTTLDALMAHPNMPPFVVRQLIQRLVTSNPSPAYVDRAAVAFATGRYVSASGNYSTGAGRRGDMKATIAAIVLDAQARDASVAAGADFGKLREPVLRLSAMLRASEATSQSNSYRIGVLDSQLFQTPLRAPSVFNYFRPGYVPPNTELAGRGLVGPEFQIAHEVSTASYANFMQGAVANGLGSAAMGQTGNDVRPQYTQARSLATDATKLVDHLNLLLTHNSMSASTRSTIINTVNSIPVTASNAAANRVNLAMFMTVVSPEFLVHK